MNNVPAAPANLAATYICCEHPPINPALLCPFSVGEIIARSDRLEMDGCKVKPLSFRPFGKLSIEGDARSALPAVLAWMPAAACGRRLSAKTCWPAASSMWKNCQRAWFALA